MVGDDNCVHPLLMKEGALGKEVRGVPQYRAAYAEVSFGGVCRPESPGI